MESVRLASIIAAVMASSSTCMETQARPVFFAATCAEYPPIITSMPLFLSSDNVESNFLKSSI
ncbi:MAG: hypothetical protein AAGU26_08390 [bacterium]|nr:hypothetical protein [Spirochaetales bacterium]